MTSEELLHHVTNQRFGLLFSTGGLEFHLSQHLVALWLAVTISVLIVVAAARIRRAGGGRLATGIEFFVLTIRDQVVFPALGEHYGRKYLDFFLTIALLILVSNLLGLIPPIHLGPIIIGGAATGNFWVNLGLASLAYFYGVFSSIREHGLAGYIKSYLPHGIPVVLMPFIWIIEFGGILIKHAVLAIRLTANMIAGHLVIFAILGMILTFGEMAPNAAVKVLLALGPILLAAAIFLLELLVAFIQTAVFTILAAIFFGMAVNPHH